MIFKNPKVKKYYLNLDLVWILIIYLNKNGINSGSGFIRDLLRDNGII